MVSASQGLTVTLKASTEHGRLTATLTYPQAPQLHKTSTPQKNPANKQTRTQNLIGPFPK